jgi:hypothetical protein
MGHLTALYYRNFRENKLPPPLEAVLLATRTRTRLHDGTPPHFGRAVIEFFNEYEGRCKGRGAPVA